MRSHSLHSKQCDAVFTGSSSKAAGPVERSVFLGEKAEGMQPETRQVTGH
jgi:hypothetical protein